MCYTHEWTKCLDAMQCKCHAGVTGVDAQTTEDASLLAGSVTATTTVVTVPTKARTFVRPTYC